MPFCHITQYCRSNTAVDIARILKVSTSPAGIKYKFGIQVLKGIKNEIDLDKKNGNQLWQEAMKTELKQLTKYRLSDIHSTRSRGGYSNRLSENSLPYGF
jgi:intein-encoded DNA endonuclease-like protein